MSDTYGTDCSMPTRQQVVRYIAAMRAEIDAIYHRRVMQAVAREDSVAAANAAGHWTAEMRRATIAMEIVRDWESDKQRFAMEEGSLYG